MGATPFIAKRANGALVHIDHIQVGLPMRRKHLGAGRAIGATLGEGGSEGSYQSGGSHLEIRYSSELNPLKHLVAKESKPLVRCGCGNKIGAWSDSLQCSPCEYARSEKRALAVMA